VGGMPEQVAFEEYFRHIARAILCEAAAHQKRSAETLQVCASNFRAPGSVRSDMGYRVNFRAASIVLAK